MSETLCYRPLPSAECPQSTSQECKVQVQVQLGQSWSSHACHRQCSVWVDSVTLLVFQYLTTARLTATRTRTDVTAAGFCVVEKEEHRV